LPLNGNGKVDRKALPAPDHGCACAGTVPPRDDAERAIADIWCEVLGLERIGVHDNFFELGGHSLKAARVVSRVRRGLGRVLPLAAFFQAPTGAGAAKSPVGPARPEHHDDAEIGWPGRSLRHPGASACPEYRGVEDSAPATRGDAAGESSAPTLVRF